VKKLQLKTDQLEQLELVLEVVWTNVLTSVTTDHIIALNQQAAPTTIGTWSLSCGCHKWLEWCTFLDVWNVYQ